MFEKIAHSIAWQKAKWVAMAVMAGITGILMFLYGKKTLSGLSAVLAATNQKAKVLNAQIKTLEIKAKTAPDEAVRKTALEKADTLKVKQVEVKAERLRLLNESDDLEVTDDTRLAAADNARRARTRAG